MTGRGRDPGWHRVIHPPDDAAVQIPISLSTSPAQLDPKSEEPYYVVVTAHNPGDRAITFFPLLTPFMDVRWGAFANIASTTSTKIIQISPRVWPHWTWESEDLERDDFITIPAAGSVSIKHEVSKDAIDAAEVASGEHYQVKLAYERTGCKWWSYGTLQDLESVRLRIWRPTPEFPDVPDGEEDLMQKEWREKYGHGPWTFGERPDELCFVGNGPVEFSVA